MERKIFKNNGDDDDRNTVVTYVAIKEFERIEHRLAMAENTKSRTAPGAALSLEDVDLFGSNKQLMATVTAWPGATEKAGVLISDSR